MLKEKLLSRAKIPAVTLNKKLIIAIISILLVIFIAIIVEALSTSSNLNNSSQPNHLAKNAEDLQTGAALVNDLPQNYGDANQISALMQRNGGLNSDTQRLISSLQSQQAELQQQLQSMKMQGSGPSDNSSPLMQEATSSSIFFAGGAPQMSNQVQSLPPTNTDNKTATAPAGANGTPDSYAQQNMQGQKLDFLTSKPSKDIYNNNTVQYPASPYILQAGSIIPTVLQTKISTDLPGVITAVVSQDVFDSISGKYLLIPRGSRLIGEYNSNIAFGQDQVQAKFTRLIRPDGTSIVLPNQPGVDDLGTSGLQDEVNNHWGRIIGSAVLSAIFNIPAIIATNEMNNSGSTVYNPSTGSYTTNQSLGSVAGAGALQGAGQSASNVGNALANKSLNIQPTIIINPGYQFSILVSKDIILPPYAVNNGMVP